MFGSRRPAAAGSGADAERGARHRPPGPRRPQRRDPRHRHQDGLALRRAAQHPRSRRGDRADHQRPARPRRGSGSARSSPSDAGFVWLKREITPDAAGADPRARHSRRRLPAREPALLSGRPDRRPHRRPRQHRQPGHRRHREICRRPLARAICTPPASRAARTSSRSSCRSTCASSTSSATSWPTRWSATRAIAATGIILNVHTGEVLAMASLPDFDPNNPVDALEARPPQPHDGRRLRARLGVQELHLRHGARLRRGDA